MLYHLYLFSTFTVLNSYCYLYLFSIFTDTKPKFNKIALGDGILACMSRDFGVFMPKHLAGQWVLNSYCYFTFIFSFAVLPFADRTVIVTVPFFFAVIFPFAFTEAIFGFEDL